MLGLWLRPLTLGRLVLWHEGGLYHGRYNRTNGPEIHDKYPTLRGLLVRLYLRTQERGNHVPHQD